MTSTRVPERLIARGVRPAIWIAVGGCVLVIVFLLTVYHAEHLRKRVDLPVDSWLRDGLSGHGRLFGWVADLGAAPVVVVGCAIIAVLCLFGHRRRGAALAILGPALAVAITEWVVKPIAVHLVARYLVFPSGHTTAVGAVATVVAVLLLGPSRPALAGPARAAIVALAVLATVAVAVAVVVLRWHVMTDTIGGVCVGVATVLAVAVGIDAVRPG